MDGSPSGTDADAANLSDADADTEADAGTDADADADAAPACTEAPRCVLSSVRTCVDGLYEETRCDKGCTEGACNTRCDAEAVAIDQSIADDHAGPSYTVHWQSFQLATTGVLTALELRPNVFSAEGEPSHLTLSIYVGEGIDGPRIAQQQYEVPSVGASPWRSFMLESPVPLQENQTYTWAIAGARSVWYAKTDVYAAGRAKAAGHDMVFKAHMAACY